MTPSIAGLIAELRTNAGELVEFGNDHYWMLVHAADALEKQEQSIEDLVQTVRQEKEEVARLSTDLAAAKGALNESVKLQSHYAVLLNDYDGGYRKTFANSEEWLARLAALQPKVETP